MRATFKNKVVIVAGGASGMGKEVVRQLAEVASRVIILDRNKHAGTELATSMPESVMFRAVEMTNSDEVTHILREINKEMGPIDYFFNFAGSFLGGEMRDTPVADWHEIMEKNVAPAINGTVAIYDLMQKNGRGHIVNVASAAGLFPVPAMSIYGGSKSAVIGLSLGLRLEAKTFNIKVSVVCPTIVQTPLYDTAIYNGLDRPKALDLLKNHIKVQQPDVAARRIIKGVIKNKPIIHTALSTHLAWGLYRISPSLYIALSRRSLKLYRRTLRLR
jgi:short-subunit dehydrogenase